MIPIKQYAPLHVYKIEAMSVVLFNNYAKRLRILSRPEGNSNQIIFIGLRSGKDCCKRPGGVAEVYEKGHLGVSFFYMGRCVLREWVVREGGLGGYFREQGLPVGIQK